MTPVNLLKTNLHQIFSMWPANLILVEIMLNFVTIFGIVHYQYSYNQHDLLYWRNDLMERPLEYLLSSLVLIITIHIIVSCLDSTILTTLVRRYVNRCNKPRLYYEEHYRRFIIMRLVQQLEIALTMQMTEGREDHQHIMMAQELIKRAVNEFRASVRILLWPNRSELIMDPHILYHIDESQLAVLKSLGYSLSRVSRRDLSNSSIRRMLNPAGH
ncbi:uncharacterized protein Dwil_GK19175 [Drosophila willistoni]|uniref:Uncharacterized protein n=1 Tax=Drosophila willistoni TaxID=7260 RepID=B4N8C5_DROWI|nr:uncharacterized protein LOC6648029 [Drosophila willistoni]EDW81376.1 uncharacterized protein Dwil_GK19175 [Drosophila willistoni]